MLKSGVEGDEVEAEAEAGQREGGFEFSEGASSTCLQILPSLLGEGATPPLTRRVELFRLQIVGDHFGREGVFYCLQRTLFLDCLTNRPNLVCLVTKLPI